MQKIFRRKNDEVPKDFICTQGCGKAYGSYAALYTHLKNKHNLTKIQPSLKTPKPKGPAKKGRPIMKQKSSIQQLGITGDCKICLQQICCCDSSVQSQQIQNTIQMMKDKFLAQLLNDLDVMSNNSNIEWIRNTEQKMKKLDNEQIIKISKQLTLKLQVQLQDKLQDIVPYLSFISSFINPQLLIQFISAIMIIKLKNTKQQVEQYFNSNNSLYQNISKQITKVGWDQFYLLIKNF